MKNKKFSITFSGAGAKVLWQIGAAKALKELNLQPDICVGTSSGSIVAAFFGADQIDDLEAKALHITSKDIYSWAPWKLFTNEACALDNRPLRGLLRSLLSTDNLHKCPYSVLALVSDLSTWSTKSYDLTKEDPETIIDAVVKSTSVPVAFPMTDSCVDGGLLADYGVAQTLYEPQDMAILISASSCSPTPITNVKDMVAQILSVTLYGQLTTTVSAFKVFKSPTELVVCQPDTPVNIGLLDFDHTSFADRKMYVQNGYDVTMRTLQDVLK